MGVEKSSKLAMVLYTALYSSASLASCSGSKRCMKFLNSLKLSKLMYVPVASGLLVDLAGRSAGRGILFNDAIEGKHLNTSLTDYGQLEGVFENFFSAKSN